MEYNGNKVESKPKTETTFSPFMEDKISALAKDPRLQTLIKLLRIINRHDTDELILRGMPLSHPRWIDVYKKAVDTLVRIHLPSIYGKAIQIDKENLIELPEEDKHRFNVIVFESNNNELKIAKIDKADKYETDELLALVGRHPFVDPLGWHICKVAFNPNLKECIGIGQKTMKDRGGDFDGDAIMVLLLKLPKEYYEKYAPEVTDVQYNISESIQLPKSINKAVVKTEIKDLEIPDFDFPGVPSNTNTNELNIYPETISHLQNTETLAGAILLAINIATGYRVRWTRDQLKRNTEQLISILKAANPEILQTVHRSFLQIITPLILIHDIDVDLYQAVIRIHIKDKGPSLFGYLQKVLLSVTETPEEIERVLNYISQNQQKVLDMKKGEHSILHYNNALLHKRGEVLANSEIGDLYERWKNTDYNWSKDKSKLLTFGKPSNELDKLATVVHNILYE